MILADDGEGGSLPETPMGSEETNSLADRSSGPERKENDKCPTRTPKKGESK